MKFDCAIWSIDPLIRLTIYESEIALSDANMSCQKFMEIGHCLFMKDGFVVPFQEM